MTANFSTRVDQILRLGKRILLVEHDSVRQSELVPFLQQQKNDVVVVKSGLTASEKINSGTFDLVIIDKNLPYNDAITLYNSIKNRNLNMPVIFITDEDETCEVATIKYADFKQNYFNTLRKIVEKSLRSTQEKIDADNNLYKIGSFILDYKARQLRYKNDVAVKLTPKESKLLKLLITNNNKLVDKNLLQKKVWYNDEKVNYSSMNVYISRLRKLLKKDKSVNITNVYKTGFKISG